MKRYFGIDEKSYSQFKELNKWVIKPAVKEINAQTDLIVRVESYKTGRRISHIQFLIRQKEQFQPALPLPSDTAEEGKSEEFSEEQRELQKRFQILGIAPDLIKQALKDLPLESVEIAAEALEAEEKRVGLRYPNNAFEDALKKCWKTSTRRRKEAREAQARKEKLKREEEEAQKKQEKELQEKKEKEENEKFAVLSDEEKFDLLASQDAYKHRLQSLSEESFRKAVYENVLSKYPDNVYRAIAYFGHELSKMEKQRKEEKKRAREQKEQEERESRQREKEAEEKAAAEYEDMTDEEKLERLFGTIAPEIAQSLNRADHDLLRRQAQEKIIGAFNFFPSARSRFKVLWQKLHESNQTKTAGKVGFHSVGDILDKEMKK